VECIPEREVAAGSQQPVSLPITGRRIDPVPGGRGVDEVEGLGLAFPRFERRVVISTGSPARLRRARSASCAPISTQTTKRPRSSRGRVALPLAQPISKSRSPGSSSASSTRSSNSSFG